MPNQQPPLRFDHREVAVIFSLFVFVSLLMFTVGILVGKGLAQARYEGSLFGEMDRTKALFATPSPAAKPPVAPPRSTGASVTTPEKEVIKPAESESKDAAPAKDEKKTRPGRTEARNAEPLKLIPKSTRRNTYGSLAEPTEKAETEKVLDDPKLSSVVEDAVPKQPSGVGANRLPASFPTGKFTVQVGSYSNEKDAVDRVMELKKLGFHYAYFSAKELGDNRSTWYRVWLGYFPDKKTATQSGEILQQRGEVKNYLVRKTDTAG